MPRAALLGCPPALVEAWRPEFAERHVDVEVVPSIWGLTSFKLREVDVVVLGPDVARPAGVARRISRRAATVPVLVVQPPDLLETVRETMASVPAIPRHVRVVDATETAEVASAIIAAARFRRLTEGVRRGRRRDGDHEADTHL